MAGAGSANGVLVSGVPLSAAQVDAQVAQQARAGIDNVATALVQNVINAGVLNSVELQRSIIGRTKELEKEAQRKRKREEQQLKQVEAARRNGLSAADQRSLEAAEKAEQELRAKRPRAERPTVMQLKKEGNLEAFAAFKRSILGTATRADEELLARVKAHQEQEAADEDASLESRHSSARDTTPAGSDASLARRMVRAIPGPGRAPAPAVAPATLEDAMDTSEQPPAMHPADEEYVPEDDDDEGEDPDDPVDALMDP